MPNYTFQTLNDKEFEELCRDLLSKELGVELQSFKKGKDGGIDLRYSTDKNNGVVVQVKHYIETPKTKLFSILKKEELPNVIDLNPSRYIIATSKALLPQDVDKIKLIFGNHIKSAQDIYHFDTLNSLISKYKDIEVKHYKLWLSSINILKNILHNSSNVKTELHLSTIEKKIKLYVPIEKHKKAFQLLKDEKIVLITGPPGVGKSTLADILIFSFLRNKDYELIVVDSNLEEALDVISLAEEKKQVIYFDDFLGSNILQLHNSENSLVRFINRIKNLPNKYLIITSRTTILNQAIRQYEKLSRIKNKELKEFEIRLESYSKIEKAKILYNHIFFCKINDSHKQELFKDKNYLKIIEHRNFNPRLIEYITTSTSIPSDSSDYLNFITKSLNNPKEIWEHSYKEQLSNEDRLLLGCLFTLNGKANLEVLENAYDERIKYEISTNGYMRKEDSFNSSLKELEKGYLEIKRAASFDSLNITFKNPSISDFLFSYFKNSKSERKRILLSCRNYEQIFNVFHPTKTDYLPLSKAELKEIFDHFVTDDNYYNFLNPNLNIVTLKIKTYLNYFHIFEIESILEKLISPYPFFKNDNSTHDELDIIISLADFPKLRRIVSEYWEDLIYDAFASLSNEEDIGIIPSVFEAYEISLEEYIEENESFVEERLSEFYTEYFNENLLTGYLDLDLTFDLEYNDGFYDYDYGYYNQGEPNVVLKDDLREVIHQYAEDMLNDITFGEFKNINLKISIEYDHFEEQLSESHLEGLIESQRHQDDDEMRFIQFERRNQRNSEDSQINNLFS